MESDHQHLQITAEWQTACESAPLPAVILYGLYGAAIALASSPLLDWCVSRARQASIQRSGLYEIAVHAHLFLGFPRSLIACDHLSARWPSSESFSDKRPPDLNRWEEDGALLARQVYGSVYERLLDSIDDISPELRRWMITDGYGKVLSRPGLSMPEREYSIIAMLAIDDCHVQLISHLRGAVRLGCDISHIDRMLELIRPLAEPAVDKARSRLRELGAAR